MKKYNISEDFYSVKTRDRIGGTILTDVFKKDSGLFTAFSSYWQDEEEETVGFAEDYDDEQAVKKSRKNLRKAWKEERERKGIPTVN